METKLLLTATFGFVFITASAQMRVNNNGNVSIGTSASPLSALSIGSAGDAAFSTHIKTTKSGIWSNTTGYVYTGRWGQGGYFKAQRNGSGFFVGAQGAILSTNNLESTSGRAFGVIGSAGFCTPGYNYGVFGRLDGTTAGAGVYGTAYATENGIGLTKRYAGYFNGDVGVNGNLNVTGKINGVLLGTEAAAASSLSTLSSGGTEEETTIHDSFSGLTAVPYYKPSPVSELTATSDTADTAPVLSAVEAQDLSKIHYALSAEQLQTVYPELVYDNGDGTKGINYIEMIPLLVQSISELNAKIALLENPGRSINAAPRANSATSIDGTETSHVASLSQNTPNPFANTTSITMTIPENAQSALLCLYDMTGKQIKQITVTEKGNTAVSVTNEGLGAGMYLYSLIIDGNLIDTKRMVLTK